MKSGVEFFGQRLSRLRLFARPDIADRQQAFRALSTGPCQQRVAQGGLVERGPFFTHWVLSA